MIRFIFIVFACLFFSCLPAQAKTFNAQSFTLDNGLQVVIIPNHRAPVVTHMIWYKVGAADEPAGSSGMAHYFEHLMFKGTKKHAPGEFSKIVRELGGNDNAFTSQDYTAYFQSISKEHLKTVMAMESDRMIHLQPPPDHFQSEKKVVIEERRQHTENDPRGLFFEQLRSTLFVNHPHAIPVVGWMNEIRDYQWDDVRGFYQQWYAPNNAVVVISGDVTINEVKPLAEKTYGKIKSKKIALRERPKIPPAIGNNVVTLHHEAIYQPTWNQLFLVPAAASNKKMALSLEVLQEILSGGPATRLYKSLVIEQNKAVSVYLSYNARSKDYGTISLSATPAEEVPLQEIETLFHDELQKIIVGDLTDEEVQEAIKRMQAQAIFARDSLMGPAMIFGQALMANQTIEDVENWPQDIGTITKEDIQKAAALYLNVDKPWIRPPVTGYLLPPNVHDEDKSDNQKEEAQ